MKIKPLKIKKPKKTDINIIVTESGIRGKDGKEEWYISIDQVKKVGIGVATPPGGGAPVNVLYIFLLDGSHHNYWDCSLEELNYYKERIEKFMKKYAYKKEANTNQYMIRIDELIKAIESMNSEILKDVRMGGIQHLIEFESRLKQEFKEQTCIICKTIKDCSNHKQLGRIEDRLFTKTVTRSDIDKLVNTLGEAEHYKEEIEKNRRDRFYSTIIGSIILCVCIIVLVNIICSL